VVGIAAIVAILAALGICLASLAPRSERIINQEGEGFSPGRWNNKMKG